MLDDEGYFDLRQPDQGFEYGKNTKRPELVADGVPLETVRKSTDISILRHDLEDESFRDVSSYIEHFNIQKFDEGATWECFIQKRTSLGTLHRMRAGVTHLIDAG